MTKQTIINRITLFGCCLALAVCLTPTLTYGQSNETSQAPASQDFGFPWWGPNPEPRTTIRPVVLFSNPSVVVSASGTMLVRTRDNVFATLHTSGLMPGTVVTFWWAFFNSPGNCATQPCTPADLANPAVFGSVVAGGGRIIGADGTASFSVYRQAFDTTGVFTGLGTVQGLLEPLRAQIHLVIRTHGPAITDDPDALRQQLSLFNGGCPPNTCANLQASIHQP